MCHVSSSSCGESSDFEFAKILDFIFGGDIGFHPEGGNFKGGRARWWGRVQRRAASCRALVAGLPAWGSGATSARPLAALRRYPRRASGPASRRGRSAVAVERERTSDMSFARMYLSGSVYRDRRTLSLPPRETYTVHSYLELCGISVLLLLGYIYPSDRLGGGVLGSRTKAIFGVDIIKRRVVRL